MARYRKRTRSDVAQIIAGSISIASRLHWKKFFIWGVVAFVILYFLIPGLLPEPVAQTVVYQPLMDKVAHRGQWIFEKLGIGVLVIFWFFALLNLWKEKR